MSLLDDLIQGGWLKTPQIIEAFKKIERKDFLPRDIKNLAELNEALPIGFGQTISQPLTVAFMFEKLQPARGEKILDVGSGSGWTTALLAEIVGKEGKVVGIEIVPELKEFGQDNVKKYDFAEQGRIEFICADGSKGYPKEAPFDKILCSAAVQWKEGNLSPEERIPEAWKKQLKAGGKIVTPINSSIWVFQKKSEKPSTREKFGTGPVPRRSEVSGAGEFEITEYPGFVFVPLVIKPKR